MMEGHSVLPLLRLWKVADFAWHPNSEFSFHSLLRVAAEKLFSGGKKRKIPCVFFSNHWPCSLAESSRIIAEAPEATRPVGREITVSEELAHCLALLESDTHEEVPTQGKEGSCRGFMKCVKKYSSYGSRKFTNSRGTCCAPERSWNILWYSDGEAYFIAYCACLMSPQPEIFVNLLQPGMSKRSRKKNER